MKRFTNSKKNSEIDDYIAKGNIEFGTRNYAQALDSYSEAAKRCSNANYLVTCMFKRYECFIAMKMIVEALEESLKITSVDKKQGDAYRIALDCYISLGQVFEAEEWIRKAKKYVPDAGVPTKKSLEKIQSLKSLRDDITDALTAKYFKNCLRYVETSLAIAPHCDDLKFLKMRCLMLLKRFYDAENMKEKISDDKSGILNKMCFQALKLYYAAYIDESLELLRVITGKSKQPIKTAEDVKHKILRFKDQFLAGNFRFLFKTVLNFKIFP